jgi:TM2 domain-containing membrane protein YozV
MRNIWIRFGCFLTGYNYSIIRSSSEVAAKSVKKYTAAIVIVCILWFFIGFTFAHRYLQSGITGSVVAGILSVIIIVQIERQIVLSIHPSRWLLFFRSCLALMMAILGAVIIDQILLEKDIELEKVSYVSERVDSILPSKTFELKRQIAELDTTIRDKEAEKRDYIAEVSKQPTITFTTSQTQSIPMPVKHQTPSGRDTTIIVQKPLITINKNSIPNPKAALIAATDSAIAEMWKQRAGKQKELLNIKPSLEKEMKEKTGFLDELKVMYRLISNSAVALAFWLLWILFFLFIEMLVLFSKMGDKSSDYEKTVLHHMNLQLRRLDALAKES